MHNFKWKKVGLIFKPDRRRYWMKSHAALPIAVHLSGSLYRVFFSSRDNSNRSHVGWFILDFNDPNKKKEVCATPILTPGPLGNFDDHGIYAASVVKFRNLLYLYTIGWNPGRIAPLFYSSIGLAISRNEGVTFEKFGSAPIMSRSSFDPCLVTSPFVRKEGVLWRMWYVSGIEWQIMNGIPNSKYHIKYAESKNGIHWRRNGTICIDNENRKERNIARICILKFNGQYNAWYSFNRGEGYRIGYASSPDGIVWRRENINDGLTLSTRGWDSESMSYPWVIKRGKRLYMLYNGNSFGKDGIGMAVTDI